MKELKDILTEGIFDVDDHEKLEREKLYNSHPANDEELKQTICNYINDIKPKEGDTIDLNWIDVSRVQSFGNVFSSYVVNAYRPAKVLQNYNFDVSEWDVSNSRIFTNTFFGCKYFNCDLSKWNMKNAMFISGMFYECSNFEGKGLEKWRMPKLVLMKNTFCKCEKLDCDLSKMRVPETCEFDKLTFAGCDSLKQIPKWYHYKR